MSGSSDPVRDEKYFEHGHSSPHNPPSDIPDSADSEPQADITPELEVVPTKIIPVVPGSRFVILIPQDTDSGQLAIMQTQLTEWWESNVPFLIAGDQFEFVKVDEHSTIPELADCGAEDCPGHTPGDPGGMCDDEEVETNGDL